MRRYVYIFLDEEGIVERIFSNAKKACAYAQQRHPESIERLDDTIWAFEKNNDVCYVEKHLLY